LLRRAGKYKHTLFPYIILALVSSLAGANFIAVLTGSRSARLIRPRYWSQRVVMSLLGLGFIHLFSR